MRCDSGQAYPPALQMNEKQHVVRNQPSERKHFHPKEVGRHQYRHVSTDKVFPKGSLLPFGSRWNIMAAENIAHRLIREPETQVGHGAHDPVIAPPGIFLRHPPGRPGEFRPEPPTDPDVNLSTHPARATQRRLPPSIKTRSSSGYPLTPSRRGWPAPFAPRELPRFLATTKQCAPDRCIGTFGLVGSPLVPFPLSSPTRFSSSIREPGLESRLLYTGHRIIGK